MKKGFTLIEMAIVLVVIGLILGMVMKGRSLIDAAQTKAEINKINKISAAVATYFSKYNRLPGKSGIKGIDDNTTRAIFSDLTNEGLLSEADFTITSPAGFWNFSGCASAGIDAGGASQAWEATTIEAGPNLCIYISTTSPRESTSNTLAGTNGTPKLICYIEGGLDDKSLTAGSGRAETGAITNYDRCDDEADTRSIDYMYRVY